MTGTATELAHAVVVLIGVLLAAAVGYLLFVFVPGGSLARLLGVVLALGTVVLGARIARRVAGSLFPDYNVAEVAVEGPITRGDGGVVPAQPRGTPADAIVEQIERADEDRGAKALLVKLNTPGGEVVPSDDIRNAARAFDGPTVAYATDTCASGGYWIASGCDELWAREGSIVGSIGVLGSQVRANELAAKLGLSYEGITAGEYKDAGMPLKELTDDEREYFQGIVDDYYEQFLERVTAGRDLDDEAVRETEARIYIGEQAHELELVDELGTRDDVEDALADELGEPAVVEQFEPSRPLVGRLQFGALSLAYALGAGIAGVLGDDAGDGFRFRI